MLQGHRVQRYAFLSVLLTVGNNPDMFTEFSSGLWLLTEGIVILTETLTLEFSRSAYFFHIL